MTHALLGAERLLAHDGHLIFAPEQREAAATSKVNTAGISPACPRASLHSLAFLRATAIQNFISNGDTSAAYIGSVQVGRRWLAAMRHARRCACSACRWGE